MLKEGVLQGEGQGMVISKDGQGMASWTGQGVGRFTGPKKSVSEVHYSFKHLRHLKEESCHF